MQVMREFYCMTTHKTPLKIVGTRNTSAEIPDLADIYSMGYMHDDEGFYKFFAYLNLFIFSANAK